MQLVYIWHGDRMVVGFIAKCFVLLFYIVNSCIDIEDRSLSCLYFNKIILSYLSIYLTDVVSLNLDQGEVYNIM